MIMRQIGALLLAILAATPALAGPMRIEVHNFTGWTLEYLVAAVQGTVAPFQTGGADIEGSPATATVSRSGNPICYLNASVQMLSPTVAQCDGSVTMHPGATGTCDRTIVNQGVAACKIFLMVLQ